MFKHRCYDKELLDADGIDRNDLFQNLKELETINRTLGGHRISIQGMEKAITDKLKRYQLTDIGCGGGDSLKAIAKWSGKQGVDLKLSGVDLQADCIRYARESCKAYPEIGFTCADFKTIAFPDDRINIVHASLFFHHFTEKEISEFMIHCSNAGAILIINDLERNPWAYYSIRLLTGLFSKSHLVKNDAPLSVRRGFKKTEWQSLLQQAGIKKYVLENRWAFRHLIICYPND
jgi:2-polyprenyl-3-methyl-5-hydroxy-6-metoxy-1,4-benzoquinol methylase